MQQVPDSHEISIPAEYIADQKTTPTSINYYPLLDENESLPQPENLRKKWFAFIHAFLPKFGDFSTNYFIYLKINENINFFIESLKEDEVYPEVAAACFMLAIYFAVHSLLNDLWLYIPAEEYQNIYDYLLGKKELAHNPEDKQCCSIFTAIARPIGYFSIYSAFGILSANSAVGTMAALPNSIFAKVCGVILALISTELGIFYSHMVFNPRINKFIKLIKEGYENFEDVLKIMAKNPSIIAQIIKSFGIISCYYTIMGIFYLYSLVEQLSEDFSFTPSDGALNIAMISAGILIFITNIAIRFPANLEKYFSSIASSQEYKIDIFQELLITTAGLTLSVRRLPATGALLGIFSSITSLLIGLRSIYLRSNSETALPTNSFKFSFIPTWLNGHSRLLKSTILPFAAIGKIMQMLKKHGGFNFQFDLLDTLCTTIIFAIPIGVNSSKMYKRSIQIHLNYVVKKFEIERNTPEGLFGKFYCLFKPSKAYPSPHREILSETLKFA